MVPSSQQKAWLLIFLKIKPWRQRAVIIGLKIISARLVRPFSQKVKYIIRERLPLQLGVEFFKVRLRIRACALVVAVISINSKAYVPMGTKYRGVRKLSLIHI